MSTVTGERIRHRRQALGLSQSRLAAEFGLNQSTVAKWESGPNMPRPATLQRLAERLKVSVAWLLGEEEGAVELREADTLRLAVREEAAPAFAAEPARLVRLPVHRGERDLPVYGVAVGGEEGFFELNGQVHEFVERPAQLQGVDNAYALYVLGDSMEPRYMEGEIVYINPNRPVTRGCFVAVELETVEEGPGKGMIKQFERRTPTKLVLRQFNPVRVLEFPLAAIKHCHRIVQGGEP